MKKTPIAVALIIIAILGSCLTYNIVQQRRGMRGYHQFLLTTWVQVYQDLDRGDVDAAKRRLGVIATLDSEHYEKMYGQETGTKFAATLQQAKVIKTEIEAMRK